MTGEMLPSPERVLSVDPAQTNLRVTFSPDGDRLLLAEGSMATGADRRRMAYLIPWDTPPNVPKAP